MLFSQQYGLAFRIADQPLALLGQAMQTGLQQGMRIAQVIAAKIHTGLGNSS